jgi:hypothetical protein
MTYHKKFILNLKSLISYFTIYCLKISTAKYVKRALTSRIFRAIVDDMPRRSLLDCNIEWSILSQFNEDGYVNEALNRIVKLNTLYDFLAIEIGAGGYSSNIALTAATFGLECWLVDGSKRSLFCIKEMVNEAFRLLPTARSKIKYIHTKFDQNIVSDQLNHLLAGRTPLLASVDIDSFDEHILRELMKIKVPIIIAEYNSCFGSDLELSILTSNGKSSHTMRRFADKTLPYFGFSYRFLQKLAEDNGYFWWKTEKHGINAVIINNMFKSSFPDCHTDFYNNVLYDAQFDSQYLITINNIDK